MLSKMAIPFEVTCILMHRDMDNPVKDSKDLVLGLQPLLELQIFVPKRVSEEIKTNTCCASLEQPTYNLLVGSLC